MAFLIAGMAKHHMLKRVGDNEGLILSPQLSSSSGLGIIGLHSKLSPKQ